MNISRNNALIVNRLTDRAKLPTRGSDRAAGLDIYACSGGIIYGMTRYKIQTGIAFEIPTGYYGQILPRSGLALRDGIMTMAGVIDNDYRGELAVVLFNSDDEPFTYSAGDRIAQMVLLPYLHVPVIEGDMSATSRGNGGLGSTGR